MKEIWKDIKDFEGLYQVSNLGKIKSLGRKSKIRNRIYGGKVILGSIFKNGYICVSLCKDSIMKKYYIHRLVAEAFLDNILNKETINHIDGNKLNNCINNLEWATYRENNIHAFDTQLIKRYYGKNNKNSIPVVQYDKNGRFIKEWECIRDVERELKINSSSISQCCKGRRKTAGRYKWKYIN